MSKIHKIDLTERRRTRQSNTPPYRRHLADCANSLVDDTTQGTVQNVASALSAITTLLSHSKDGNNLCFLLMPLVDALEFEASR